jgi:hypothetical protein
VPETSPVPAPPAEGAVAGWVAPPASQSRPTSPVALAILWLVAIGLGIVRALPQIRDAGSDAYEAGRAIGIVAGAIVIAFVLRFVWVKLRGGGPILRSGWVPLTAIVITVLSFASSVASIAPPTDPETAMRVAAPYTLADADPTTVQQITDEMRAEGNTGPVAVKLIHGPDGSTSVLFATDARLEAGDLDDVARGFSQASGLVATVQPIAGRDVVVAVGPDAAFASWIDSPLLVNVVAADETTLRAVTEAVLGAPVVPDAS